MEAQLHGSSQDIVTIGWLVYILCLEWKDAQDIGWYTTRRI